MKHFLFLFFAALILSSCEEVADSSTPPPSNSSSTYTTQELEKLGQVMAFSTFNTFIQNGAKSGAKWTKSPLEIALRFAGAQMTSRNKNIRAESLSGGESFDKVLVAVEEDGLLDDSIRGTMTILRLELTEAGWQINKATRVWKCWEGRGHEDYGVEPCG